MALKSAVELQIPDIIHQNNQKSTTIPQLISSLNIHPSKSTHLERLMRILTHPNCLTPFVSSLLLPEFVSPWHVMGDWFRDGDEDCSVFEKGNGMAFWEYNERDPGFNSLFNEAMGCDSRMMNLVVGGDCGWVFDGVESLVDVGGGNGTFAKIVKKAYPGIRCKVLELPQVVGELVDVDAGGVEFVAGDMFQHVPSADAVLLKVLIPSSFLFTLYRNFEPQN
ncbi:Chavicol O-methyltransferase [Linum grandiflorum]